MLQGTRRGRRVYRLTHTGDIITIGGLLRRRGCNGHGAVVADLLNVDITAVLQTTVSL